MNAAWQLAELHDKIFRTREGSHGRELGRIEDLTGMPVEDVTGHVARLAGETHELFKAYKKVDQDSEYLNGIQELVWDILFAVQSRIARNENSDIGANQIVVLRAFANLAKGMTSSDQPSDHAIEAVVADLEALQVIIESLEGPESVKMLLSNKAASLNALLMVRPIDTSTVITRFSELIGHILIGGNAVKDPEKRISILRIAATLAQKLIYDIGTGTAAESIAAWFSPEGPGQLPA